MEQNGSCVMQFSLWQETMAIPRAALCARPTTSAAILGHATWGETPAGTSDGAAIRVGVWQRSASRSVSSVSVSASASHTHSALALPLSPRPRLSRRRHVRSSRSLEACPPSPAMLRCAGHLLLCPKAFRRSLRRLYHRPLRLPTCMLTCSVCSSTVTLPTTTPRCVLRSTYLHLVELAPDSVRVHSREPQACPGDHLPLPSSVQEGCRHSPP